MHVRDHVMDGLDGSACAASGPCRASLHRRNEDLGARRHALATARDGCVRARLEVSDGAVALISAVPTAEAAHFEAFRAEGGAELLVTARRAREKARE